MKKIALSLFILVCIGFTSNAQSENSTNVRRERIGFSFIGNDFATAERIRTTSYATVLREERVAKLKEMGHGFALHYFRGFTPNIDLAATFGGSFVRFALPGRTINSNRFLAEIDASANFKMFSRATFNPYLIAGIGASKYTNVFGAFIPVGGGVNINLFNELDLFSQLQYRIPVTPDANKHHFQVSFGIASNL
ncbi:MAG TPA: hypothetical protein VGB71_11345 [Flavisolibacter sp.]